jgi:hypothetical protein
MAGHLLQYHRRSSAPERAVTHQGRRLRAHAFEVLALRLSSQKSVSPRDPAMRSASFSDRGVLRDDAGGVARLRIIEVV